MWLDVTVAAQHPRVRFAVCQAVGQMSTDFAPPDSREVATGFQSLFHAQAREQCLASILHDERR